MFTNFPWLPLAISIEQEIWSSVFALSKSLSSIASNFFCSAPPDKMLHGKSSLNAYAAPYIPISNKSCIGESRAANEVVGFSGKREDVGVAAGCHFSGNVSLEQSLEKLHVSDETYASEKLSMMDDSNKVEFLMWRFRGYCPESLSDFLKFNNGDLYDTIDFLEEFEINHHTKSPGTSEALHGAGPASPNSCSRGKAGLFNP